MDHNKLWKILKEMGILDHLTCLLRKLYVGQEATVRTLYGTINWFKIEKGVWPGVTLFIQSICWAHHEKCRAGWVTLRGIEIGGRNINNLRYEDDTILMAESEEELKSLLMRVKEESEKAGLGLNIKKKKKQQLIWHQAPLLHGK